MILGTQSDSLKSENKIIFYKKLLSQIPDLIFQLTLSNLGELNFTFLNKSVINYFELSLADLRKFDTQSILEDKIVFEDLAPLIESLKGAQLSSEIWEHEFRCILPKKGLRWFKGVANVALDENGQTVFFGRVNDVTERKQKDIELKISEQRFQFAMEASTKGIWDLNLKTNKVFYSAQSMKMLGFEEKDSIDTHNKWDDRIHPEDKINYLNEIQLHLDNKTPFYENSKRMLTKEENYKWILSRGKVIERDEIGNPIRLIGTHTDISGIMEKENEMSKTLEIISEQNSRLLNFAHIVSHNLSSHSGNFKMLLEIIEDENDDYMIKEIFQHLKTSSSALSLTIDHLKELVEINSCLIHKKEKLNINSFLNRVFSILEEEIRINKVVIKNYISNDVEILFNPSYLESILLNFTTNAIKYAHPDRYPKIIYTLAIEKNYTVLEINDNGLGINLEKYGAKLFGMYKTFHNNANARGIGLFITKNQLESMGGKVEVASKVNVGTTFKIYFNNEF